MRAGIFTTTIEQVIDMGRQETRHFRLRFDPGVNFQFKAGQFVNVIIPNDTDRPLKRAYSIGSPPAKDGSTLDLCWKRIEGGQATGYLWKLKVGDKLTVQGPLGHFTAKEPMAKTLIFVSTGTGIAPFRSIMLDLLSKGTSCDIWNIFGNRYDEDILYREEFEALEKKHANFHNLFTISRPEKWTGEKDYVQIVLKKHFKEGKDKQLYICGLSAMIQEVKKAAEELGMTREQIFFEKYD